MGEKRELIAQERKVLGKEVRHLRKEGLVPAVLYGGQESSVPLQVDRSALQQLIREAGHSPLLQLRVGARKSQPVLIKQVHFRAVGGEVLHVDFCRVAAREKLRTKVPLHFLGEAPVVKAHNVAVVRALDEVTVECYPDDLPAAVNVEMSALLEPDSVLRVGDLRLGGKVRLVEPPDVVVASVALSSRETIERLEHEAEVAQERAAEAATATAAAADEERATAVAEEKRRKAA